MITPRNMADSAKTHIATIVVPAQAAGVDSADIPAFCAPTDITIVDVGIMAQDTYTGHADGSTWLVESGSTAIATDTYNATEGSTPPTKGVYTSLGAISNAEFLEGSVITYSVTNGAGAAIPLCVLQIKYMPNEVV